MDKKDLPSFDLPPVIEVVLSAQFSRLDIYSNAHAGWYWKNYLDASWGAIEEVQRIEDNFELFDDERKWAHGLKLKVQTAPQSVRQQIIQSANNRMIQIQDSRFIYNWRKLDGHDYPSYDKLLPEFSEYFNKFNQFTSDAGNKPVELNQWEVTYVNHLAKGELWSSPQDWDNISPYLKIPAADVAGQSADTLNCNWNVIIGDKLGRLHINIKHARVESPEGPEVLVFQLTARGPVTNEISLCEGFSIGHESIVKSFTEITSEFAHKSWKRNI